MAADNKENINKVLTPLTLHEVEEKHFQNQQIQCIKCEMKYEFPKAKDDYLAHLFLKHRLVIADVEEIALLEPYFQFWQNEFKDNEFEVYCTTMLLDQLPDGTASKNEKYYLLSDIVPKDYELRKNLKQKRLELVLAQHQYERTDRNFQKECLFCRDIIKGLRADYLEHLFHKHFLQLGKPENLVFIDELITKVQQNMEQLKCLYCEKIFKDRVTLKEHMRKKGHKRINEKHKQYDKHFLVNYRTENAQTKHKKRLPQTPAKTNDEVENNEMDNFVHRNDDSDSDWSDWQGDEVILLRCLYCTHEETAFTALKSHMLNEHNVNFDEEVLNLNIYQKIKIINYVRRQIRLLRCVTCDIRCENMEELLKHLKDMQHFSLGKRKQWDKPEYFFPTYEDDGLLCVLDDSPCEELDDTVVNIISEDTVAKINRDAEKLSLENFEF